MFWTEFAWRPCEAEPFHVKCPFRPGFAFASRNDRNVHHVFSDLAWLPREA